MPLSRRSRRCDPNDLDDQTPDVGWSSAVRVASDVDQTHRTRGLVTLRPRLVVPVQPLQLLWDLEKRGCRFALLEDARVLVRPGHLLGQDDRAALTRWRRHIAAILAYVDAEGWKEM